MSPTRSSQERKAHVLQHITYEVSDGIATCTLSRPEQLNAYTPRMGLELRDAMYAAAADDEVRAIILTGAGRGFCPAPT